MVTARSWDVASQLRGQLAPCAGVGVVLSATIELMQMFIPVRVTSLSDPMVAACGCALGVLARQHALRFYVFATSIPAVDRADPRADPRAAGFSLRERPRRLKPAAQMSPTDELIATLTEPHEGAPAEHSPASPPPVGRKPGK